MKIQSVIAATLFTCLPVLAGERQPVAEFTPEETTKLDWSVVDDGVMGGLSQGNREIGKDGILRFFGKLSLENNGGTLRTAGRPDPHLRRQRQHQALRGTLKMCACG